MEVESAFVAHPRVAETAVVSRAHEIKGESIFAYVVCRGTRPTGAEAEKLSAELREFVGRGTRCHRQTRRHPLRRQPAQDPLRQDHAPPAACHRAGEEITQDISTLENPAIVEQLRGQA
jgi:acetyl-CoA synthetase